MTTVELTLVRSDHYGPVTEKLSVHLEAWRARTAAFRARREAEEAASQAQVLAANAAHLGVDVDLASGWMAMDGEAL